MCGFAHCEFCKRLYDVNGLLHGEREPAETGIIHLVCKECADDKDLADSESNQPVGTHGD